MSEEQPKRAIRSYKDLEVWQSARKLVRACYILPRSFPESERSGLMDHFRRVAISVASNIAEGHGRGTPRSFLNHLWIANGSLVELETQLILAIDLEIVAERDAQSGFELISLTGRLLTGLRRSIDINH